MNPCSAAAVRRRPTRLLLLAALLFAATVALAAPSSALAAACPNNGTTSWTNPNGGSWDDSANWDNGVPGGSCTVNITTPGNYVVTMAQGGSVAGLTLGGASGTQALEVAGSTSMAGQPQQSLFSIGAGGVAVGTHGVLRYTSVGINPGDATSTGGGTIVNSGLVETDVGTVAGNRDIQNNVTNNVSGVIAFHTSTNTCGCGNTHFWVNHGTITTDSGTANTFTGTAGGVVYSQDGGTFTNNGHAVIAGTVTRTGGTTTGNAIEVCGTLNTPAPGAASFEFDQQAALGCGGGEIDADVGSGTTITIHNTDPGHSLSVSNVGDFTNNGTIRLDGTTGAAQDVLIGGHVLTNSSTGAIQLAQPGSSQLQMKLVNHGDVHVSAGGTAVSGVSSNDASETTDAGTSLVFATDFTGSGGTIANAGLFRVGGTFTHTGGNSTGTAINLCGATLHAPGPGTANFEFDNLPGTCSGGGIDGDIGSGDSVRIHDDQSGDHAIGTTGDFANHGILTFDGSGPGRDIIVGGHTITNTGTIQLSQPGSSEF
ncbi:MAG: fibronectin-binding autotransporter adhesin, partial [Gaiellales bacterium]|nr:fibronectin-binding autotransporter adhesin [Gaiellales bacterium]